MFKSKSTLLFYPCVPCLYAIEDVAMADPDTKLYQILEELGEDTVRVKNAQYEWGGPGSGPQSQHNCD